ncbi:DUF167 domain-containing protein [Leptolyngbya sp. FACHB-321]
MAEVLSGRHGKANQELIQLLAEALGVTKAYIRIKQDATSRTKRVAVDVA